MRDNNQLVDHPSVRRLPVSQCWRSADMIDVGRVPSRRLSMPFLQRD